MERWEGRREGGSEGGRVLERKGRRGREGGRGSVCRYALFILQCFSFIHPYMVEREYVVL